MIRWLTLGEALALHRSIIATSGGAHGVRDLKALESSLAQPRASFGGEELYPDIPSKAAALGFSLAKNHPFIDGNKRIAHAAMETFLYLNGLEIQANVDQQERAMLSLASGDMDREGFLAWLRTHVVELE